MALIKCPSCGADVSDRAVACKKCGYSLRESVDSVPTPTPPNQNAAAQPATSNQILDFEIPSVTPADSPTLSSSVSDDLDLDEFYVQPFWKKHKTPLIVIGIILVIAAITNPSERKHRATVASFLLKEITNIGSYDPLISQSIARVLAESIERQSLIFISLTKTHSDETVGIGAFGHVWTWVEYRNPLQENMGTATGMSQGTTPAQQSGAKSFTDSRDGQKYRTVTIGGQTWIAQNLNHQTGNSWCYDNNSSNCDKYGRLYDWNTAKTVCPSGWSLPSSSEWDNLLIVVGGTRTSFWNEGDEFVKWKLAGNKLKAKTGWNKGANNTDGNGTDDYGFSALPGGGRSYDGSFYFIGKLGIWWTTPGNVYANNPSNTRSMSSGNDDVDEDETKTSCKYCGNSVRCVKN